MMINKRLIGTVPESRKYIAGSVALQWCSLAANIALMAAITRLLAALAQGTADRRLLALTAAACAVLIRWFCTTGASRMSDLSSRAVKRTLREAITVAGQSEFISAELPVALQNKYFEYQTQLCHDAESAPDTEAWERAHSFLII